MTAAEFNRRRAQLRDEVLGLLAVCDLLDAANIHDDPERRLQVGALRAEGDQLVEHLTPTCAGDPR